MTGDERRGPDEEGPESDADDATDRRTEDGRERETTDGSDEAPERAGKPVDLATLSYNELQSLAADHGIPPVGHGKDELRGLIAAAREEEHSDATDDDTTENETTEADTEDESTEIPTLDPDDPSASTGGSESGESDESDGKRKTADGDSDPAVGPDGSIPDWVKSDEPTIEDALGPERPGTAGETDDERDPDAENRVVPDDELPAKNPFDEIDTEDVAGADAEERAQSDGGATVLDGTDTDYDYYDDGFIDGPEEDREMPLADHIEEMVKRLGIVIISMALVSIVVLPFAVDLINFIWYSILGSVQNSVTSPRAYQPLALVLARLKVATLAGFVVALPVFVYETYRFMRPGLYKHERRYYLAAVPTSLVLAFIGVAFAFYLVLPFIFSYFVSYSEQAAEIAFGLTETFGLMLLLMGFFAAVFQIPLLIMLAVMMGLTTRRWLVQRRLYFWGGFLGVALLFSPDPTGLAPFIVAITMVTLFEATLLLLRWTQR